MGRTKRYVAAFLAAFLLAFTAALPGLHTCVRWSGGTSTDPAAGIRATPGGHLDEPRGDCPACHFGAQGQIGPPPLLSVAADPRPVHVPVPRLPRRPSGPSLVRVLPRGPPPSTVV